MTTSPTPNPVLVDIVRGDRIESTHRGSALVVDADGQLLFSIGDADRLIYPRSSLKLMQAIPLVESGAADAFGLGQKELCLACASHNAEPFHTETVQNWLAKLSLASDDLECGATLPLGVEAAKALIASQVEPTRMHQNCSGKHCGMLTLARHLDLPTAGYSQYDHPVNRLWMKTLGELLGIDTFALPWERDGCGLPALAMPMQSLALGFARFASIPKPESGRGRAMARVIAAVQRHPSMIAGTDRCCSAVIARTGGRIVVKTGAEGVYGGCVPERGLGFALKIDDGATRGSEVALGALIQQLNVLDSETAGQLDRWFYPEIKNSQGYPTGRAMPSREWKMAGRVAA